MLKNSILNVFSEKRKLAQGVTLAIAIFFLLLCLFASICCWISPQT